MKDIKTLCDQVRQTAYDIHVYHGHGHLEIVYENALAHRLRKAGLGVKQQHPIKVYDEDGTLLTATLAVKARGNWRRFGGPRPTPGDMAGS
jgi:GxxExxY protein